MSELFSKVTELNTLGSLFKSPKSIYSIMDVLQVDDFEDAGYGAVYAAMLEVARDSSSSQAKPFDLPVIADAMKRAGTLDKVGGIGVLTQIMGAMHTGAYLGKYVKTVKDYSRRRKMVEACRRAIDSINDLGQDLADVAGAIQSDLSSAANSGRDGGIVPLGESLAKFITSLDEQKQGKSRAISTGFSDLDRMSGGGFFPGELIVLGARPGTGKTTLALNMARAFCKQGKRVLYFQLEMTDLQMCARLVADAANMDVMKFKNWKDSTDADWDKAFSACESLPRDLFAAHYGGGVTPSMVESFARVMQARQGLDVIIIDHIQLMRADRGRDSRLHEMTDISGRLKSIALALDVPVIALSQLRRPAAGQEQKAPQLSDLRESGSIEQDADTVLLLSRREGEMTADLHEAKSRSGCPGEIKLFWQGEYQRYKQIAREDWAMAMQAQNSHTDM